MSEMEIENIKDFIRLARVGQNRGASSGEKDAFNLAKQAEAVSYLMMGLDGERQQAFLDLLRGLAWPDTREMLLEALPK